jgi:hypothetical protein
MTDRGAISRAAAAMALLAGISTASAQDIETRGAYCNDNYFGSDGAGISGCIGLALHWDVNTVGIGIVGATPEQKGNVSGDPLQSLARATGFYSREFEQDQIRYAITAHAGVEGEAADDLAVDIRDGLHGLFGFGTKNITSTKDTTFIGGVSGWVRTEWAESDSGTWRSGLSPYAHAALGNDVIEGGAGLLLAIQPSDETAPLALVLPQSGAYAPTFGGDGVGLFAGARAIAIDTLYDDRASHLIAEAGITGQVTLWDFAVVGGWASCTTEPYDGAGKADCKAMMQMGARF